MRHFYRTHIAPTAVFAVADEFFPALGLGRTATQPRSRAFAGPLGTMRLAVRPEGGHYTFVEIETDQVGESRLDRNVKRFFVHVHRKGDPAHRLLAAY